MPKNWFDKFYYETQKQAKKPCQNLSGSPNNSFLQGHLVNFKSRHKIVCGKSKNKI